MRNVKVIIYCKTVAKGLQAYYIRVDKQEYFLFHQSYRRSNKEFFGMGVLLKNALDYSCSHSTSVRKTMTKLIPYIQYIEKEYGLSVLRKTQKAKNLAKKDMSYNRQKFKSGIKDFFAA